MTMYKSPKIFGGERKKEESLLQKAVLTFLMTGVIAWPSFSPVYAASEYVRIDGGTNVTKGKVTDIYVGKMSSDNKTGVNVFQKFNVEKGDIANLRFNQKDQNVHANNLLNMVQEKININGTVNALRNGKIGGNLYFISSNGMAVGSSGAINAGSLTVMTPAQDFFKYINKEKKKVKFYEVDKDGKRVKDAEGKDKVKEEEKEVDVTYNIFTKQYSYKSDETDDAKDGGIKTEFNGGTKEDDSKYGWAHKLKISGEDKNLNDLWLAGTMDGKEVSEKNLSRENMMVKAAVPLNASGSIVVSGVVRTSTGVNLQAANVTVGADELGIPEDGAELKTGVDFSSIVNVDNLSGAQGGDKVLTAAKDDKGNLVFTDASGLKGNGAIQITAKSDDLNKSSGSIASYLALDPKTGLGMSILQTIFGITANDTASASITLAAGKITSAGDVNLSAEATLNRQAAKDSFRSLFANTEATISLDGGAVEAVGNIALTATSTSAFKASEAMGIVDVLTQNDTYWGYVANKIGALVSKKKGKPTDGDKITTGAKVKEFFQAIQVGFGFVSANANITVADGAAVTAGGNITAAATSSAKAEMSYSTGPAIIIKEKNENGNNNNANQQGDPGKDPDKWEPPFNTRMVWENVENYATVDIQGKLTAGDKGTISLTADAVNNTTIKTAINTDKEVSSNYFNLALNLLTQYNKGNVIVGRPAGTKDKEGNVLPENVGEIITGGVVNIKADTKYSNNMEAIVLQDERAVSSTAFNWLDLDSEAVTDIYGDITAKGTLGIAASNTAEKLYITANNAMGKDEMEAKGLLRNIGAKIKKTKVGTASTDFVKGIFDKVKGQAEAETKAIKDQGFEKQGKNGGSDDNWSKNLDLGSAAVVLDIDNTADVNIYSKAKLTSGSDNTYKDKKTEKDVTIHGLTLNASSVIQDTFIKARSTLLNFTKAKVGASGAAGVILLDNSSNVTLYAGTTAEGNYASLTTAGTMDVNAYSAYDWSRYKVMKSDVEKEAKATKEMLVNYKKSVETAFKDIKDKIDKIDLNIFDGINLDDLDFSDDLDYNALQQFAGKLKGITEQLKGKINGVKGQLDAVLEAVKADYTKMKEEIQKNTANLEVQIGRLYTVSERFVDAANYAQIQVNSCVKAKEGNKDTAVTANGSVIVQKLKNNAAVVIGRNSQLKSGKDMNVAAKNRQISVAIDGKFKLVPSFDDVAGGKAGLGGSVSLELNHDSATVMVAEGANLSADGNLKVDADNYLNNISVVVGGGKSSLVSITGMTSYMGGDSNALVSIDDEAKVITLKKLTLNAANKSILTSVVGDISGGQGGVVGASVGIINYNTNTLALISDNDSDKTGAEKDGEEKDVADYGAMLKEALGQNVYTAQSGTKANVLQGSFEACNLDMNASTGGVMNNLTVAGMSAGSGGSGDGHGISTPEPKKNTNKQQGTTGNPQQKPNESPKAVIAGAGSVSWTMIKGSTANFADVGVTLHGEKQDGGVANLGALDSSFIGSYSGAAAIAKGSDSSKFQMTLEGAAAYNDIIKKTRSEIYRGELKGVNALTNNATNTGAQVAAGLALGIDRGQRKGSGLDIALGASGSLNFVDSAPQAILKNVIMKDNSANTIVNNIAYDKDVQVAGGVTLQFTKADIGIGAAFSLNNIKNDVLALVEGGQYSVRSLTNYANSKLNQVSGAISGGFQSNEGTSYFSANAAASMNTVNNTVQAHLKDTQVEASEKVDVAARDGKLSVEDVENKYIALLKNDGYDVTGEWTFGVANSAGSDLDLEVKENKGTDRSGNVDMDMPADVTYTTKKFTAVGKDGNTMVGFAVVAPITTPGGDIQDSKVKILGAVTRDNFTNTFDSRIDNSTVIAKSTGGDAIGVQSKSNGSLVTVAAGVQVGKESAAGASGSVVLNYVEDTVTATVNDSVLKADSTRIYADDKSQTVGVAGAVGVKTGTSSLAILSAGLTWAQAGLNNLTGARMLGSTLDRYSSAGQANLTVQAVNDFSLYSVAAEVDVNIQYAGQEPVAVGRGAYAYNYGTNNSEAVVDKTAKKNSKISNAGKVEVTTNDKSKELAVAAAVGVNGGKVTGGAHIAKSYVGEADADKHQKNNAAIRNTEIALAGTESALKLQAYDDSRLTTIAVGGGYTGDGLLNLNGSVAKAKNYKDVETTLADSKIGVKAGVTCKALEVLAENHMKMTTSADGASVSKGTYVSGAAGVATNDSVMITKAQALRVVGADAAVGNMRVGAYSYNTLTNVGVSLTGTFDNEKAFSVDALANVAVNDLKNDTIALVDYLNVDGADTFTVEAKSEEKITNVVGAANVQIKAGADKGFAFGFGASVALNDIHGDTVAEVGNSDIKVKDKFSVNSDAFHKNKNVVFSGGLMVNTSVNANVSVGANAVVSDNEIGGKTGAYLNNSDVNKGVNNSGAVVDVKANDKIELDSTVADAQLMINVNLNPVAPNVALALGAGVLLEDLNRDTAATVTGVTGKHSVINAKQFDVNALSIQDVHITNVCAGASMAINPAAVAMLFAGKVSPDVAGAASVATSHVDSNGITLARVDCVDTDNLGLVVNAHHKDSITDTGVAATFSFGIITVDAGICVYKVTDNAKTISLLENSNITHDSDDISNDKVTATNDITLSSKEYTINAGIGLGITAGVAVWRNNFTSTAQAKINNTNIGTSAKRANRVDVVGTTNLNETFSSVEGNLGVITVGVNKVRNTINTTTAAETAGSGRAIYAKDIDVKGIETRNVTDSIWQVSVGALNVFVGDVVTNVGAAGTDNYIITYSEAVTAKTIAGDESLTEKNVIECNDNDIRESEQKADTGNRNLRSLITNRLDEINAKLDDRQQDVGNSEVGTMLTLPYPDGPSLTPVTAGVHSDVKNITLNAANDINVATETKNNIFSNSNSFRSLVNVGVVKNFVNLHQNNGVSIEGAALRADGNIFVGNTNEGSVKTFSVDAKILGALSVSVIESSSKRDGETKLEVKNSKLLSAKGTGDVTVRNKDTISLSAQVASLDTSIISGGYLEAETKDTSTMSLSVTGDSAGSMAFYGKRVSVENVFAPNIISQIIYPAGTVAKGQGTLATSWLGNDVQKSGANAPVNVALHLEEIDLFADRVDIVNGLSDEKGNYAALTAKEGVVGIGALDIGVNKGRTTANVNVKTDVKNVHSNLALAENFRKNNSLGGTLALADWNVISLGALQVSNIMENVEVGVGICSATNYTRNHVSNGVTLDFAVAEGETLEAKNLTIEAKTVETGIIHVKSNDGGIIAISPVAAGLKNDANFKTTLNLSGKYVVLGAADIQSEHKNGMRIYADGHSGNILGGSAVKVYNTAVVDNATNVRNAEIVAGGSMTVKSTTQYNLNKDVAFEGDNRSMLYASNKGGVAGGEGSNLDSSITINDNTNIADSKLRSQGQMLLEGYGNHEIYVVQSAVSSSVAVGANETTVKSTINETDRVTTSGNTEIVAAGKDADLYVVASNGTSASVSGFSEQTFSLVAAGAACYVTDNITRNNIINIGDGSHLYSGRDTNIFANLDEKRVMGSLSLDESSRTFASGIITVPYSRITSNLNQNNQVTLAEGAKVDSFGNVNIYANYGRETIDRKTGSYCWYKNNLQGEFMSTSASKPIASIMRNNFVDVKGAITAGTLNSLTITIGGIGSPVLVVPDAATKAMFASSGYTVYTIDDYEKFISFGIGNEEFKEKTGIGIEQLKPILVTAVGTENQTLQKLYGLMGDYSTDGADSRIYKTLKSAADLLEQQVNKGTSSSEPGVQRLSENLCVVIPDILVSGGNVNIETGVLRGNGGNITAKGMRDVSITNNSSMMLKVNNITVVNPGGNVNFNEITLPETGYLKRIRELNTNYADPGNFNVSSSQATVHPEVKIEGKWGGSGVSHSERSYKLTDYRRNSDGSIVLDGNGNPVVVYLKKVDGKYVETTETEADMENVAAGKVLFPADVYVVGGIENLDGSVSVVSDHNNIVISSTDGAGIRATQVLVKAEHGSLVQLSPNQTINIDGSPEAIYGEVVNNAVNWLKSKDHLYKEGNVVLEIIDWAVAERNGYMSDALATWYNNLSQEDKSQLNNGYIKIDGAYVKVSSTYSTVTDLIKLQQQHKPYYEYLQSSWVNRYDKPQKFVWVNRVGNPMGATMEKPATNPNDGDPAKSGYIMGSDITLVGADININGIVQSGYAKYQLNLTDADEDRINLIKASHLSGGGKPLTDAEVLNNEQFLVRKGGAVYDAASGSYRYEVAAYYNPDEDTVVVPSVNAEGGNIFLAGRIASTGNGKIICMDGVSTIDVKNTYNHSLALNDLLVGERQGKVTIVDAGLEKSVEIARDGITAKAFDGVVDFNTDQVKYNASTGVYKYYPKENLKYEWVSGDDYSEVKTYLTTKRATWWGWSDYKKYGPDVLKSTDPDTRLIGVQPPAWKPRTDGSFIVEDSFFKDQDSLQVTRTYNSGTSVKSQPKPGRSYTTGLYGCHKWQEYTWEEKNGYSFTNQVKMRADLPVQILFIGQQNAKESFVNITNEGQNKTVKLYGDIGNTKLYEAGGVLMENGNVNITSKGGIERLGGEIYARNVDLSAVGDISGVQVRVADAVNLDAWSTLAGSKVSVNVNKNYLSAGTVNVGAFGGKDGNNASVAFAQLITQGDVLRADSAKHNANESLVVADRINIVSSEGAVGSADNYLNMRGGQAADSNNSMSASVNVDARGDIYLCQTAGSLRAGRIASKSGDLFIEVPDGGILDAQSIFGQDDRPGYKQDLLSEWAALGLINDGSDLANKQIAMKDEAIQRERDLLISERDAVATTKDRIAEIDVELQNLAADKTKQETSHRDVIASLDSIINGKGTSAEKDAAKKLKAEFERKWSGYWTNYHGEYNKKVADLTAERNFTGASEERKAEINKQLALLPEKYQVWNGEQMLYAMENSIINPEAGYTSTLKDPNLYARNINLKVRDSVGVLENNVQVISSLDLYEKNSDGTFKNIDKIRALSWADKGSATYNNDRKEFTLVNRVGLGLQQSAGTGGKIVVTGYDASDNYANGSVFMEGRKFQDGRSGQELDLAFEMVKVEGSVRLISLANLINAAKPQQSVVITKGNLFLSTGDEIITDKGFSIGNADNLFTVQAAGNVQLLATGDIYLRTFGDLNILDAVAGREGYEDIGGNICLTSDGNIYGVYVDGQDVQGNIRSGNGKNITLETEGSIGSWDDDKKTVRFKNVDNASNSTVSLSAKNEVVVEGVSTAMALPEKLDNKYQVPAQGKLFISKLKTEGKKARITVNGKLDLKEKSFDFGLNDSEFDIYSMGNLQFDGDITAAKVVLSNAMGMGLGGKITGKDVVLQTGVVPVLTAGVLSVVNGDGLSYADVTNHSSDTVALTGEVKTVNLTVKAGRDIDLGGIGKILVDNADLSAANNVIFKNYAVSGLQPGNTDATVKVHNGEKMLNGRVEVTFGEGNDTFTTTLQTLISNGVLAKGDVLLNSRGNLINSEGSEICSNANIVVTAAGDLLNYGNIYTLNTDITGTTNCDVTLQATGNVFNSGDIYVIGKGNVVLSADAVDRDGLDYAGMTEEQIASYLKTSTINEVEFKGVYNTGDIYALDGDVTLRAMYGGDIYNDDDFHAEGESVIASSGSISLLAPYGIVENTKTLVSGKNITIESYQDIYNLPAGDSGYVGESVQRGLETLNGTITLISHGKLVDGSQLEGLVVNKGLLKANNGDIVIVANGSVKTDELSELEDVIPLPKELYDGITYSFLNDREGDILTTNGNIVVTANQSVVSFGDMMALIGDGGSAARGDISLCSSNGNVVVYSADEEYRHVSNAHNFIADGDMSFKAPKGYVYSDKGMYSKGDLFLEFGAGEQTGEVISDDGDVTLISRGVDEKFRDLTISNHISAANGKVTIVSSGNLTINDLDNESSGVVSKDDIVLNAEKNIKVIDVTDIRTGEGGIEIQSNKGSIDITGPVNAKGFVRVYTKGGSTEPRSTNYGEEYSPKVDNPEEADAARYGAEHAVKKLFMEASAIQPGDISIAGNIVTDGDVDLAVYDGKISTKDITAAGHAVVGNHSGGINIDGTIKAEDVALYSEDDQIEISYGGIKVERNLILAGNNWNVSFNDIEMGENVNLYVYGAGQSKAASGNFTITYHKGIDNPLYFRQLSAGTVTIDAEGPLIIDNLSIGDRAEFNVMGTRTDVYGKVHDYDKESPMIFFTGGYNSSSKIDLSPVLFGYDVDYKREQVKKLSEDPRQFELGGSGVGGNQGNSRKVWYKQLTPEEVTCNADLLKKNRDYTVYGQRCSMESLMQNLGSVRINNVFDAIFNTNIQFFTRYNTITIPDVVVNEPADLKKDEFEF